MKKHFFLLFWVLLTVVQISCGPSVKKASEAVSQEKMAPDFPPKGTWLQSAPLNQKIFEENLTLVYFWDYTSLNCLRELGYIKQWEKIYRPYGFQVILIHSPEFQFAADQKYVEEALKRYQISFPVLLDNYFHLWDAYDVVAWPTKILVNNQSKIVHRQTGEGNYQMTESVIRKQLQRLNSGVVLPEPVVKDEPDFFDEESCGAMTAETYMGYKRLHWWGGELANKKWIRHDETGVFRDRGDRVQRGFFLHGLWSNKEDYFEHARATDELSDYLGLSYSGYAVYSVLSPVRLEINNKIYVTRDEQPVPNEMRGKDLQEDDKGTFVLLDQPRLYHLIQSEDRDQHELKLWSQSEGVSVSSFVFANRCMGNADILSK